jgi:hypothetical protein
LKHLLNRIKQLAPAPSHTQHNYYIHTNPRTNTNYKAKQSNTQQATRQGRQPKKNTARTYTTTGHQPTRVWTYQ